MILLCLWTIIYSEQSGCRTVIIIIKKIILWTAAGIEIRLAVHTSLFSFYDKHYYNNS